VKRGNGVRGNRIHGKTEGSLLVPCPTVVSEPIESEFQSDVVIVLQQQEGEDPRDISFVISRIDGDSQNLTRLLGSRYRIVLPRERPDLGADGLVPLGELRSEKM
jgi:hypothetical protein